MHLLKSQGYLHKLNLNRNSLISSITPTYLPLLLTQPLTLPFNCNLHITNILYMDHIFNISQIKPSCMIQALHNNITILTIPYTACVCLHQRSFLTVLSNNYTFLCHLLWRRFRMQVASDINYGFIIIRLINV